ncbi:MAG: hypothetical protein ABI380_06115 [Edaphobacter sp.]
MSPASHSAGQSPVIIYNRSVRRLLAVSLLLLFSFPLVSPLFALSANSDAILPVCCRRNGAHHCQMNIQRMSASAQGIVFIAPAKCPFYPGTATLVRHNDVRLRTVATLIVDAVNQSSIKAHTYTHVQSVLDSAWQKRGPPAVSS